MRCILCHGPADAHTDRTFQVGPLCGAVCARCEPEAQATGRALRDAAVGTLRETLAARAPQFFAFGQQLYAAVQAAGARED